MELTPSNLIILDDLLTEAYGPRVWQPYNRSALDILILTLLTQATNDSNAHKVFKELKNVYPEWEDVLKAPWESLVLILKPGGLSEQKATRIKGILQDLKAKRGELSLEFLEGWKREDAFEYLLRFKGVGPKTAACTLLFAWNKDVFPVDTHIHRISKRIGLVDEKTTAVNTQRRWQEVLPAKRAYSLHVGLIEHGRKTCIARRPQCHRCNLNGVCDYPNKPDL